MAVTGAVTVDGPVRTQALPRKGGATRTRVVPAAKVQLLTSDPRRARVVLMSMDQELMIAYSDAAAQDPSTMTIWPKGVPFECTATVDVFVQCAADAQTTRVSVTTELWAEG